MCPFICHSTVQCSKLKPFLNSSNSILPFPSFKRKKSTQTSTSYLSINRSHIFLSSTHFHTALINTVVFHNIYTLATNVYRILFSIGLYHTIHIYRKQLKNCNTISSAFISGRMIPQQEYVPTPIAIITFPHTGHT